MVVAPLTLTCLVLSTLFAAALPVVLYRRLRVPLGLNARDAIAGIAVFALFASVIERALNGYVLHQNATTAAWLSNPLTFVIYGALAAVCHHRKDDPLYLHQHADNPRLRAAMTDAVAERRAISGRGRNDGLPAHRHSGRH